LLPTKAPKIAVLLAAYNGMQWIEEQVNTILDQAVVQVTIFISVDPSRDGTYEWCKELEAIDSRVVILPYGERFGNAAKNFFRLIRDVDFENFDYISLADQDDIWLPNKLQHAISLIQFNNYDAVSSDVIAFWDDGREKLVKKSFPQKKYDYLFEAAGPGCTYVFKATSLIKFQKFLLENPDCVNKIALHDWALYAYFRHKGYKWFIDDAPSLRYRQHLNNQVGFNSGLQAYKKRVNLVGQKWYRNEVKKISQMVGYQAELKLFFRLKNFWQLRRRPRDVFALLAMNVLGIF
jgi:rhamnosyltransferase